MPIQDIYGRVGETTAAPRRVVSLVPSATETLFEFGARDRCVDENFLARGDG